MVVVCVGALLIFLVLLVPAWSRAALALRRSRRVMRWQKGARAPRTSDFDQLPMGPVALRGKAVPIDPLSSAWSGREGVYLCYSTSRYEPHHSAVLGGVTEGQWTLAESDEVVAPFEIAGGESSVLVDPEGARVLAPTQTFEQETFEGKARRAEQMIESGDEVIVVGTVAQVEGFGPSRGYRGHSLRNVVKGERAGDLLVAHPTQLSKRLDRRFVAPLLWLLPPAALVLGALLAATNALPWTVVELPGEVGETPEQSWIIQPFYGEGWSGGVYELGRVTTTYLGYGALAEDRFRARVRVELERRGYDGIAGNVRVERRHFVFHVISVHGPVVRRQ